MQAADYIRKSEPGDWCLICGADATLNVHEAAGTFARPAPKPKSSYYAVAHFVCPQTASRLLSGLRKKELPRDLGAIPVAVWNPGIIDR